MTGKNEVKEDKTYEKYVNDEYFKLWFSSLKKNTAYSYQYGIILFCKHCQKTPTQLIKESQKDYVNRVAPWEHKHIKQIESFITYLKNNISLSNGTKLNRLKAVKNFYEFNKIPVMGIKSNIVNAPTEKYQDIPLLKLEDIRKAIHATGTNKMLRALILTLLSSGQGQAEIRALKGKHLKTIVQNVAIVDMTRGKTNRRYSFFIGKEAIEAIKDYKPEIKDDELIFTQSNGNPLTPQDFDGYILRLCDQIGFERGYFSPHRFRHFFKSTLTGNIDTTFIEYMMGHKLPGVESSYFKGSEKILEQYLKNIHLLTAFEEKEVLQKELDVLRSKDRLEVETLKSQLDATQKDMASMRTAVDFFNSLTPEDKAQMTILRLGKNPDRKPKE